MVTFAQLMSDERYKLKLVETSDKYYRALRPGIGIKYTGRYGNGYRVYFQPKKDKIVIYYFIREDDE